MILIPALRQILNASASLGTMSRAAGVSKAAPDATKSFCMSTTIIAVLFGLITSIFMASSRVTVSRQYSTREVLHGHGIDKNICQPQSPSRFDKIPFRLVYSGAFCENLGSQRSRSCYARVRYR